MVAMPSDRVMGMIVLPFPESCMAGGKVLVESGDISLHPSLPPV